MANGFKINKCNKCIYVKKIQNGYVILCLNVDDILIVKSDDKMVGFTKNMLKFSFEMIGIGLADVIFRIKISRISNELILS